MKKSVERVSSDKSSSESGHLFSFKRYFVNNLDSYHGEYFLKEMSKILEKNAIASRETSQTIMGEDVDIGLPPPEQLYEIIGKSLLPLNDVLLCSLIFHIFDSIRNCC